MEHTIVREAQLSAHRDQTSSQRSTTKLHPQRRQRRAALSTSAASQLFRTSAGTSGSAGCLSGRNALRLQLLHALTRGVAMI